MPLRPKGHDLIAQHRGDDTYFYHVDGLGSTRLLTDIDGAVTDRYWYDAYGELISSLGDTENSYLYTGEQFDEALGEYYLRARYYDPDSGRFVSRDPFEGFLTDPLSLAKYPYVHGNPVNSTDPSGLLVGIPDTALVRTMAAQLEKIRFISSYRALTIARSVDSLIAANWVRIVVAAGIVSAAAIAEGVRRFGIPVVVHARDLQEHALHIANTQTGVGNVKRRIEKLEEIQQAQQPPLNYADAAIARGSFISPFTVGPHALHKAFYVPLRAKEDHQRTPWINTLPVNARLGLPPRSLARDEFPFASTKQGGGASFDGNRVSLRYVPGQESNRQGRFIDKFYRHPNVDLYSSQRRGVKGKGEFVTLGIPLQVTPSGFFTRRIRDGYVPFS
ncbi:MAG: hypothetical protein F6K30_24355 [Cyanothece sp. SIO2G6]|nr:hypothetical protein [Cyanothece sp. SIO2G6]